MRYVPVTLLLIACAGCTSTDRSSSSDSFNWIHQRHGAPATANNVMHVRWSQQLLPRHDTKFATVQYASAALDPERNQLYVGTTQGELSAFDLQGRKVFGYPTRAGIEGSPAVDKASGDVYVGTNDGVLHALSKVGELRWKQDVGEAIVSAPVLTADAAYVVTTGDSVIAMAVDDGRVLWTYRGDPIEEFTIAGHAGLVLDDDMLITGLTDGRVIALDATNGQVVWEIDTSADVEASQSDAPDFFDVDTTPAVVGDTVYIASFTAGLYALERSNGTVVWHDESFIRITGLAASEEGDALFVTSATRGVTKLDVDTRKMLWSRSSERGAPTRPVVLRSGTLLFGETQGSLFAVSQHDGRELARVDSGNGFTAPPTVNGPIGAAISNGGNFICLGLR